MKIVIFIFFLSLSPAKGQGLQSGLEGNKKDSLFFSDSRKLTFTDSLRNAVPKNQADVSGYLYKVVWVTFFLLIFLVAGLFLYKKLIFKNAAPYSSTIRIIGRQNLSAKQSILIVKIEDKKYALGVTEQQVNLIAELGEVTDNDMNSGETRPINFGQFLKNITTKK